jgi:hypothetical protein
MLVLGTPWACGAFGLAGPGDAVPFVSVSFAALPLSGIYIYIVMGFCTLVLVPLRRLEKVHWAGV